MKDFLLLFDNIKNDYNLSMKINTIPNKGWRIVVDDCMSEVLSVYDKDMQKAYTKARINLENWIKKR
ncbi:hypothetical protein BFS06_13515 [Clostridium perfringens]|uniref:Uncharacterized protein n=1 Tax=Clostridium perfringens TaxID=1502 RepID=A0A140GRX0_CLOPF|nr:hypothetical protein [Clostridium perfringens]AMN31279.1 hypothetical protein JFP838_pA0363 [Clostridium perfringens]TBX14225.1 hypothetical protein BFS06_13515 [Clostridium perfringens]